jgi:predicted nucleic acid-binding protein
MNVQLDTNILTLIAQPSHPRHDTAVAAVRQLESSAQTLRIVPQNLFEFWAVATRPVVSMGLGLTVAEAKAELDKIKKAFLLNLDPPSLLDEWERLFIAHECKGKVAHDTRIVAAMNLHGATALLTFNGADFARYPHIGVLDPEAVVAAAGALP